MKVVLQYLTDTDAPQTMKSFLLIFFFLLPFCFIIAVKQTLKIRQHKQAKAS